MREWFEFPKKKGFSLTKFLKKHESSVLIYLRGSSPNDVHRIALDVLQDYQPSRESNFESLENLHAQSKDWLFGFFGYDLKNEIEELSSDNFDGLNFPDMYFFQPVYVIEIKNESVRIGCCAQFKKEVQKVNLAFYEEVKKANSENRIGTVKKRIDRENYLKKVEQLKKHIYQGDIYEVNFCQEFYIEEAKLDPVFLFEDLIARTDAPFACYLQLNQLYLMCASPERFVGKNNNRLITQPIKGTARRGKSEEEDLLIKQKLLQSQKERSENVMIVDLVRNDLSKTAVQGTVRVDELFGIYTFKTVHQMISTVSAELNPEISKMEAIKGLFPAGSMTGAPKLSAMQLIEKYESTKRGLYAGSVGYFTPEGNFDFNVVIRSIMYNAEHQYVSFITGGAITAYCDPEKEYEECLLKAEALISSLEAQREITRNTDLF